MPPFTLLPLLQNGLLRDCLCGAVGSELGACAARYLFGESFRFLIFPFHSTLLMEKKGRRGKGRLLSLPLPNSFSIKPWFGLVSREHPLPRTLIRIQFKFMDSSSLPCNKCNLEPKVKPEAYQTLAQGAKEYPPNTHTCFWAKKVRSSVNAPD